MKKEIIKVDDVEYIIKKKYDDLAKKKGVKIDEKDYCSGDPSNIMMIGKVHNVGDEKKPLHLVFDFERDNTNLKIMLNLKEPDVIDIVKDGVKWARISKEYYDKACQIICLWTSNPEIFVQKEPNYPILITGESDLGFILAPRVEDEG